MKLGQISKSTQVVSSQDGEQFLLDKYHFIFRPWTEEHSFYTYGGKQILQLDREPLFAELLVLRLLERQGYKGVWVDTYRNQFWQRLPHFSFPVIPDKKILDILNKIYNIKGGRKSGCFDIVAYREDHFVFAELKRQKEDHIRPTQIEWLKAGISAAPKNATFLICEWTLSV